MAVIDTMGGRLMLARKDAGLSQLELLEKLKEAGYDITPAHWSRVEGNKRGISLELLTAVADILEQSLDYLVGRPQYTHEVAEEFATEEAATVARLVDTMDEDMRRQVVAHTQALKRLDERGYPSPRGGQWASGNVVWIVRNVWRYAGYVELNKKSPTGLTYIKAKSKWPAILTDEEATAIQAERHRRWFARGSVHSPHRFSQCVWCEVCNSRMDAAYVSTTVKGKRYTYEVYRCSNKHPGRSVMAWKVDDAVRASIEYLATLPDLAAYMPETADRSDALRAQLATLQERMAGFQEQLERADDAYTMGTMNANRYQRQVERIEKQMAQLTAQITDAEAMLRKEQVAGRRVDRLEEVVSSGLAMLTAEEIPTANAYFRRLLRVWVRDNNVTSVDVL